MPSGPFALLGARMAAIPLLAALASLPILTAPAPIRAGTAAEARAEPRAGAGTQVESVAGSQAGSAAEGAPWTLARDRDGIVVHIRPVADSGIDEFRGSALVDAPVDAIRAVLRDVDRFEAWFPNTSESRLLSREGLVQFQYTVIDAPWPVSDRDNVFRSETTVEPATGTVRIAVTADPERQPEHPERVRVRRARGEWLLEPVAPERTRVTFTMHLEPGGGVPEWLLNARVVETPFEALTNLRARLAGR